MKKKILIIALAAGLLPTLFSCTENERARQFGGTIIIELPVGEKLIMATWKDIDLFYLTEPMDSDYIPKVKTFREASNWGVMESTVIFKEKK
ncbi:hypothetical protein [Catenibacterium sp.]|uniref:hypothetical protein n=1 Tax=Catenibacterium sp. TaxID=2049022 RepID=UPI002E7A4E2E|nr:hypothetical protein [Catenibacterium sp.]MEE0041037.1 hypothetical protein [Catenibacterium sp.]